MSKKEIPAKRADPGPKPRFTKNARPNSGKTLATVERKRSFPARTDAAYAGYAHVTYVRMPWEDEVDAGKVEGSPDDRYNPMDALLCSEPEDEDTRRNEDTSHKSNLQIDLGQEVKRLLHELPPIEARCGILGR